MTKAHAGTVTLGRCLPEMIAFEFSCLPFFIIDIKGNIKSFALPPHTTAGTPSLDSRLGVGKADKR